MFRFFMKKVAFQITKGQLQDHPDQNRLKDPSAKLSKKLCNNLQTIQQPTGYSSDIIIREFSFGQHHKKSAALIFVDGLADSKIINKSIIEPLLYQADLSDEGSQSQDALINQLKRDLLSVSEVDQAETLDEVFDGFLSGDVALLIDGLNLALVLSCKGWEKRSIGEPSGESVIRGPRESFTENIRTNTALIRRKIKNPALTIESMKLGEKTRTKVCLVYIHGVANPELIAVVKERLASICTDSILESGYIEQYIEDSPASFFATIGNSEKPDVIAANLLEGRIAIVVDGTPFVLTAPYLFIEGFQTAEDYYFRPYFMTMLRLIRYIAFVITVFAPAIYVAVTTYHQELIPTDLLFTMASAREGVPFPAFLECFIMLLTFEILREAGVRLPRPVGQAMSIVGALVIGEAAVSAGLIGAPMVIVVSITAVSVFVVPKQEDSSAMLRLIFLVLSAIMGGYGITIGLIGTLIHLSALESFGVPYLAPLVPSDLSDSKDALIRAPLWLMVSRPKGMARNDRKRKDFFVPPAEKTNNHSQNRRAKS